MPRSAVDEAMSHVSVGKAGAERFTAPFDATQFCTRFLAKYPVHEFATSLRTFRTLAGNTAVHWEVNRHL